MAIFNICAKEGVARDRLVLHVNMEKTDHFRALLGGQWTGWQAPGWLEVGGTRWQ